MEMGHGDEIGTGMPIFPATLGIPGSSRYAGIGIPQLLEAILELLPLDQYAMHQAIRCL